jgi:hypothetical protein
MQTTLSKAVNVVCCRKLHITQGRILLIYTRAACFVLGESALSMLVSEALASEGARCLPVSLPARGRHNDR